MNHVSDSLGILSCQNFLTGLRTSNSTSLHPASSNDPSGFWRTDVTIASNTSMLFFESRMRRSRPCSFLQKNVSRACLLYSSLPCSNAMRRSFTAASNSASLLSVMVVKNDGRTLVLHTWLNASAGLISGAGSNLRTTALLTLTMLILASQRITEHHRIFPTWKHSRCSI